MDREYRFSNDGRDGYIVKNIGEVLPNNGIIVLCLALHVEAVVLSDTPCFVVAADHRYAILVFDFQQAQQSNDFDTVCASVDVVPEEQVAGVRQITSHFEYLQQIVELSVNITDYCNWC